MQPNSLNVLIRKKIGESHNNENYRVIRFSSAKRKVEPGYHVVHTAPDGKETILTAFPLGIGYSAAQKGLNNWLRRITQFHETNDKKLFSYLCREAALDFLCNKFPKCFISLNNKKLVRAFVVGIRSTLFEKVKNELPQGLKLKDVAEALATYCKTARYRKALESLGNPRIDLDGNVVGKVTDEEIQRDKKSNEIPNILKDYIMSTEIIEGRLDVTVKINVLPTDAKNVADGNYQFHVRADEQKIKVQVKAKTWRKLVKGNNDYPSWVAAITGNMGPHTTDGFELLMPAIQIFEKKPKPIAQ